MKLSTLAAVALSILVALPAFAKSKPETISPDELKAALKEHPEIILDFIKENRKQVFEYVEQAAQEEQEERQEAEEKKEKEDFENAFKNPYKPVIDSKTHVEGPAAAQYTLVEYADFQCPYCGVKTPNGTPGGYAIGEALRKKYGDKIRFVYKNMPLPFHPMAMPSAEWYEAVALQSPSKAWIFHDKLFENQTNLGDEFFRKTVKDLGLNVKKAEEDAKSQAVQDKIQADIAEAKQFGFSGTPGFLLNGIPVRGAYPLNFFDSIIERLDNGGKAAESQPE